ncbi:Rieske 2Fe-2S domain-containing protein [Glutamicibacter protophormiae]|uniref:Rieske 2Fe-2S domain-containing protein n=1 Tax=Glutamicibacter protophormiae TaxID=37930 RepID=UPI003A917ABC
MKRMPLVGLVDRLEHATALDPLVKSIQKIVGTALRSRSLRDVLHGVPLGHPVHPLAAQVPLGTWVSAAALDTVAGTDRAARLLIGVGVISALPTAVAGYADWSKMHEQQLRVGVVHSALNLVATSLYAASFVQRSRGKLTSGKVLSYAGLMVATGGGFLGGHLTYRQAAGVNHTEDVPHLFPTGWQPLEPLADFADGELEHRLFDRTSLLVFREGGTVNVLADVCSHLSGPLHEGKIVRAAGTSEGDGPCVECPWHQSVFSLHTGEVVHGPATTAQPAFDTRIRDGLVEIRLPGAG